MRVRVYYADTDAGGVVYYGTYLRWLEMARWELIEGLGVPVAEYAAQGILFAVVRIEVDYLAPAALADELEIGTEVEGVRRVRFTVRHRVTRVADGQPLVAARVALASLSREGKIVALPESLASALQSRVA